MHLVYLSLGSNLGDKTANLKGAIRSLEDQGIQVSRVSGFFTTSPWGNTNQPDFLNAAIEIQTDLDPFDLLKLILQTELAMGRDRTTEKWGPRIIDIDLLFFDDRIIQSETLIVPHPYIHERTFVLEPLVQLCPDFIHPKTGKSISKHLLELQNQRD